MYMKCSRTKNKMVKAIEQGAKYDCCISEWCNKRDQNDRFLNSTYDLPITCNRFDRSISNSGHEYKALKQRHSNRDPALHQYHFEIRNGSALAAGTAFCKQTLRQAIGRLNSTLNFHFYIYL